MTVAIAGVAIVTIQIWLFEKPPKPPDWTQIHSYEGALDPSGTVVRVDVYSASRDGNGNSDDFLLQNKIVLRDARGVLEYTWPTDHRRKRTTGIRVHRRRSHRPTGDLEGVPTPPEAL